MDEHEAAMIAGIADRTECRLNARIAALIEKGNELADKSEHHNHKDKESAPCPAGCVVCIAIAAWREEVARES